MRPLRPSDSHGSQGPCPGACCWRIQMSGPDVVNTCSRPSTSSATVGRPTGPWPSGWPRGVHGTQSWLPAVFCQACQICSPTRRCTSSRPSWFCATAGAAAVISPRPREDRASSTRSTGPAPVAAGCDARPRGPGDEGHGEQLEAAVLVLRQRGRVYDAAAGYRVAQRCPARPVRVRVVLPVMPHRMVPRGHGDLQAAAHVGRHRDPVQLMPVRGRAQGPPGGRPGIVVGHFLGEPDVRGELLVVWSRPGNGRDDQLPVSISRDSEMRYFRHSDTHPSRASRNGKPTLLPRAREYAAACGYGCPAVRPSHDDARDVSARQRAPVARRPVHNNTDKMCVKGVNCQGCPRTRRNYIIVRAR